MKRNEEVQLSKSLSWLLRHGVNQVGIQMDEGGFVKVDDILSLPQYRRHTLEEIQHVTSNNQKQRFTLKQDEHESWVIRANQGHTIAVENLGLPHDNGVISGMRSDCDLLIYVNLNLALHDGLKFYKSSNGVILSPGNENGFIVPKYFEKVRRKFPGGDIVDVEM